MIDTFAEYLTVALPFNLEWQMHDASPMIKKMSYDVLTNRFSMTPTGNTAISSAQSKYYGQSIYFDGNGDSLISAETLNLHEDFTMECWAYWSGGANAENSDQIFLSVRDAAGNGVCIYRAVGSGNLRAFAGTSGDVVTSTTPMNINTWYHVALTRSGSTTKLWLNGSEIASSTTSYTVGSRKVTIGGRWDSAFCFNGFIQDVKIYSGVAKYTGSFTPPTQIVSYNGSTDGRNLEVLSLPFNNTYRFGDACYRIKDHGSTLSTQVFGNSTISTAQSKFYGQSALFDGSGDYITVPGLSGYSIGFQNFTMEMWVYHLGTADDTLFSDSSACTFTYGAGGKLRFYTGGGTNLVDATPNYISNAWTHVAVVRSNGVLTFYQNGVAAGSHAYNVYINAYSSIPYIGKFYGGTTQDFHGYIQDFRFYIGYAKYTSGFTPSSTPMSVSKSMSIPNSIALIDSVEITSTGLPYFGFSGIPQDFSHLILKYSLKTNGTGAVETLYARLNGDQSNLYYTVVAYGEGSGTGTFTPINASNTLHVGYTATVNAQNNNFNYGASEMIIFAYSESAPKNMLADSHFIANAPSGPTAYQSAVQGINSGGYNSTTPITSIEFWNASGASFVEGSVVSLYGIK